MPDAGTPLADPRSRETETLVRLACAILIAASAGSMIGRILAVDSVDSYALERQLYQQGRKDWHKSRPFLSANDRSRWATVRALVEHGTYAIDDVVKERGWDTIDMVRHRGRDGEFHLYSSKPPLLASLMAIPYWIIYHTSGATLGEHPYEIGRFMLILFNVLSLVGCFLLLGRTADRLGATPWSRLFMMTGAAFGTFLTTYAVSINNHTVAAASAMATLAAVIPIWYDGRRDARWFAAAGFFGAFTAANELPALALFAPLTLALLWRAPRPTLFVFTPAALVVMAAAFGTNYAAHGELRPAYSHRKVVDDHLIESDDDWYLFSYERGGKLRKSYWYEPVGVDRGEPSRAKYLLHCTIGHHGLFSLTPLWLMSAAGLFYWWRDGRFRELAALIAGVSLVCFAFYMSRSTLDRNYGGVTTGLRWMFWFAPLWLLALLPAADRLSRSKLGRGVALTLLALSALSASYPTWNPWTQPWLYTWMENMGWLEM